MGEARRRGTFEERKAKAIERKKKEASVIILPETKIVNKPLTPRQHAAMMVIANMIGMRLPK